LFATRTYVTLQICIAILWFSLVRQHHNWLMISDLSRPLQGV